MKNGILAKPATFDDHAFAMPSDPPSGKLSSRYDVYDANHQRYQQIYTNGSMIETTMYVGGLLEKVTVGSLIDYRHYIRVGSQTIAVMSRQSTESNTTRYMLEDHQGSVANIIDGTGASYVAEIFTAYGARRNPTTWSGPCPCPDLAKIAGVSRMGYTGHEAVGGVNMGLNHMNGRVQDAITGRFLSADPYITEPGNTQNYNRYSYVYNNPMSFRDPSGFDICSNYTGIEEVCVYAPRNDPPPNPDRYPPTVDPRGPPNEVPPGTSEPGPEDSNPGTTDEPQGENGVFQNAREWWCKNVPAASFSVGGLELQVHFFVIAIDLNVDIGLTSHFQIFGSASAGAGAGFGLGMNFLTGTGAGVGRTEGGLSGEIGLTTFGSLGLLGPAAGGNIQFTGDNGSVNAASLRARGGGGFGGGFAGGAYAQGKAASPSMCGSK